MYGLRLCWFAILSWLTCLSWLFLAFIDTDYTFLGTTRGKYSVNSVPFETL